MDSVTRDDVLELLAMAADLSYGPSRMSLAEEAVRAADTFGDRGLAYEARCEVVESAVFGGYPEKTLVAFSWLCAASDAEPERFPESRASSMLMFSVDLLWMYKWVVQSVPDFTQISREQVESTLGEMQTRYERNRRSLRPVWSSRGWVGMQMGESPEVIRHYLNEWERSSRDAYADCRACEQNFRVEVYRYVDDSERQWSAAGPLLRGELGCAEVPHTTVSNLVMTAWGEGELERAAELHQRGLELCQDNRDFLAELAEHVDYRLATRDLEGAAALAERFMPWVVEARSGRRQWRWYVTLGELFTRLAELGDDLSIRVPADLAPGVKGHDALARAMKNRADELSARFDSRNDNTFVSERAAELRARLA